MTVLITFPAPHLTNTTPDLDLVWEWADQQEIITIDYATIDNGKVVLEPAFPEMIQSDTDKKLEKDFNEYVTNNS